MKRNFYLMCLLAFVMVSCSDDFTGYETRQQSSNDKPLSEIAQTLEMSFASKVTRSYTGEMNYPDYYGGVFLDKDGKLVVLTKGDCELYRQELTTRAASDNFTLKPCDYSLNELLEVIDELNQYMENNRSACEELKLYSFGLKTDINRVYVGLGNCSQESIAKFKATVMNDERIVYEEGYIMNTDIDTYDLAPGRMLYSPIGSLSAGYRAIRGNTLGFVTAGHAIASNEDIKFGSTVIGKCLVSQTAGTIDAAFCQCNYSIADVTAYWEAPLLADVATPLFGFSVTMEGFVTQKGGTGTITGVHTTQSYGENGEISYTLTDICTTNYSSAQGDSGGVVYNPETCEVYGIHTGHTTGYSSFCLASNINRLLGLEMY